VDYHFEDEEILAVVANTEYAKEQISRHLHTMTCDQKWSLYRAVVCLATSGTPSPKQACAPAPLLQVDGKSIRALVRMMDKGEI
jgi:hypothetical protein